MTSYFLNTFWPLCSSLSDTSPYPPFCDGSIRREPDLQNRYPSISSLCRAGKFAPRLGVGDWVIYLTCKGCYGPDSEPGWRVVAALEIRERLPNHAAAANWYEERREPLPGNCMVLRNQRTPVEYTHLAKKGCARVVRDDAEYRRRADAHPHFLICSPIRMDLVDPPQIREPELRRTFGGELPGTQSGKEITRSQFVRLLELLPDHIRKR